MGTREGWKNWACLSWAEEAEDRASPETEGTEKQMEEVVLTSQHWGTEEVGAGHWGTTESTGRRDTAVEGDSLLESEMGSAEMEEELFLGQGTAREAEKAEALLLGLGTAKETEKVAASLLGLGIGREGVVELESLQGTDPGSEVAWSLAEQGRRVAQVQAGVVGLHTGLELA